MSRDEDDGSRGFKVVDRRLFDEAGEERGGTPEAASTPAGEAPGTVADEAPAADAPGEAPVPSTEAPGEAPARPAATPESPEPPLDLALGDFLKSLLVAGLFQAGALAEQGQEPPEPDPVGARQTLNTLLMLRTKTDGNLSADEERLFADAISEMAVALALRLLLPAAARALGLDKAAQVDGDAARATIDDLSKLVEAIRPVARADALQTLEGALADLRLQFVSRVGS